MYLEHYGLREYPFSLTPDTSFFFSYGSCRDAFNTLLVALENGEGFIKVTGEVGTGKTLMCRKLINHMEKQEGKYVTAYIPNPLLTPNALILAVAGELGLELPRNVGTHHVMDVLNKRLIELNAEGRKVVLCIDEAQAMPTQTLEAVRLVTNLETEKRKLLHVVLFGQPELDTLLRKPAVRQLRQRITFSFTLQPIDRDGIDAYINYRLVVAGNDGDVGFEEPAMTLLYKGSGGIPRLINILAHKSLLLGYGKGIRRIGKSEVKLAIADTEDAWHGHFWKNIPTGKWLITGLLVLLVTLIGILMIQTNIVFGVVE